MSEGRLFLRKYGFHLTFSASIARYGEHIASQLCLAWAHKMQYFFSLRDESGDEEYVFSQADVEAYLEPPSYLDMALGLDVVSLAFARVVEIRALRPGKPAK